MRRPEGSSPEGSIPGGSFEGRAIASGCEGRAEGSRSAGSVFGSSCESSRREQGRKDDIDVGTSVGCGVDINVSSDVRFTAEEPHEVSSAQDVGTSVDCGVDINVSSDVSLTAEEPHEVSSAQVGIDIGPGVVGNELSAEFSVRPSPKPPPALPHPMSSIDGPAQLTTEFSVRPPPKPPPAASQCLSPTAKVFEPAESSDHPSEPLSATSQPLSPTAKMFEPAESSDRPSSNSPRTSPGLSRSLAVMSTIDFPPLVPTGSGSPESAKSGRSSYLERAKFPGHQAAVTMVTHPPGRVLNEVNNGVVLSGTARKEEVDVPRTKLMPVNQYMINQAELSRLAPPVQPYRKSSGLSQPMKVRFGPTTYIERWTSVTYRRYGKRHLSPTDLPTPFEAVVNSAIEERKIVEHPMLEEVVDEKESELGALTGAVSVIKSLAEHEESNVDKNCAARGSIIGDVIARKEQMLESCDEELQAEEGSPTREMNRQQAKREKTFEDLSFFGALAIHKCMLMQSRQADLLSMGQVLVNTVGDTKLVHRKSMVGEAFDDNEVHRDFKVVSGVGESQIKDDNGMEYRFDRDTGSTKPSRPPKPRRRRGRTRANYRKAYRYLVDKSKARVEAYVTSLADVGRNVSRFMKMLVDTGANKTLVGEEGSEALHEPSPSNITITGTAGRTKAIADGFILASGRDADGEIIEFKFRCSALGSMKMNLLSVSEMLKVGTTLHFETGNCYMMVPDGNKKRRVNLIEDNGLYVLPVDALLPAVKERKSWSRWFDKSWLGKVVGLVGTRSSKRAKTKSKEVNVRDSEEKHQGSEEIAKKKEMVPGASPHGTHAPQASIELWHKRLGCSKQKIKLMQKDSSVEGLNIKCLGPGCDRFCACEVCRMARAEKSSTRKVRLYDDMVVRPFQVVSTDIKGPLIESTGGKKYVIVFIDQFTRYSKLYYMQQKSEAAQKLKEYLLWVRSRGFVVGTIRTDRGSEYFGYDSTYLENDKPKTLVEFERVAREFDVEKVEASPRDGNKGNGICERHHRTIFEIASGFLRQSHISPLFWVEAYRYATLIYNSMTTSHTGQYSPYELVFGRRPRFDRIRVFGCDMYEHLADLPKVPGGLRARKGYFFGLPEDSPTGYLMYDINDGVVRTVYSATFDESFRRRLAGIKVYDTAREIYGLRRCSGKRGSVVNHDLVFSEPDDPFTVGIVRRQLAQMSQGEELKGACEGVERSKEDDGQKSSSSEKKRTKTVINTDSVGEFESMEGEEFVDLRVAKYFKRELYYGSVTKYLPPVEADDYPLWKIGYDDGDAEDWDRDELLEGIRLYLKKPYVSDEETAMVGRAGIVRQFVLRPDGEYDVVDTSVDELDFSQLKEYELHLLTKKLEACDSEVEKKNLELDKDVDFYADGPLSAKVVEQEAERQAWENTQPNIRPFRPFSHTPGIKQESRLEDVIFRDFAFQNDLPIRFLQKNPKTKRRKDEIAKSWLRYEKYKKADTIGEMIAISCSHRDKTKSVSEARSLAQRDFVNDYERGFVYFPGNESGRLGHWIDGVQMAKENGLVSAVSKFPGGEVLREVAGMAHTLGADRERSFGSVLNKQFALDHSISALEDKFASVHVAHQSLKELMYKDPNTGKLHAQPDGVKHALSGSDKAEWKKAMEKEIAAMEEFGVWEECAENDVPRACKLLGSKWVLKIKTTDCGLLESFKARLVILGNQARPYEHYDPTNVYSPVMTYDSFRTLLSVGCALDWEIRSADIKNAFLQGKIDRDIYLRHPLKKLENGRSAVVKLCRPLYGLVQSPMLFGKALREHILAAGFQGMVYDPCLFRVQHTRQHLYESLDDELKSKHQCMVKANPEAVEQMMCGCYVDDITEAGSSELILDWFIHHLRKRFVISEKATGEMSYMLSARVTRDREAGILSMDQSAAITRVAQKCGMDKDSRKWGTPLAVEPLEKQDEKTTDFDYLSVVGALLHICNVSRPDVSYAVCYLARFSKTAGESHVKALLRLVAYLYHTRYLGITYYRDIPRENVFHGMERNVPRVYETGVHPCDVNKKNPVKVFVDSDFAGNDGRSTAGHVVFLNGGPVIWSSKLMKVAATSSSEAEIIAAVEAVKTSIHFRNLLEELGLYSEEHIDIYEDNQSCKMSAESLKQHKKARHYQAKLRFLQDTYQAGIIRFHQTGTEDEIADISQRASQVTHTGSTLILC